MRECVYVYIHQIDFLNVKNHAQLSSCQFIVYIYQLAEERKITIDERRTGTDFRSNDRHENVLDIPGPKTSSLIIVYIELQLLYVFDSSI